MRTALGFIYVLAASVALMPVLVEPTPLSLLLVVAEHPAASGLAVPGPAIADVRAPLCGPRGFNGADDACPSLLQLSGRSP